MTTTTGTIIGQAVLQVLNDNVNKLGLQDVWFGDQHLLPRTPSACVIVGNTQTQLVGAARRVEDNFEVLVIVYHCRNTDNQETELECNQRAEAVADLLNSQDNGKWSGLVLHGFVVGIEPGYANKGSAGSPSWYKSSRITWQGMNRRNMSYTP